MSKIQGKGKFFIYLLEKIYAKCQKNVKKITGKLGFLVKLFPFGRHTKLLHKPKGFLLCPLEAIG